MQTNRRRCPLCTRLMTYIPAKREHFCVRGCSASLKVVKQVIEKEEE